MSKNIPFGDLVVGQALGPIEIPASEQSIRRYCDEFECHNPIYLSDSPFGGPVVPPLFHATLTDLGLIGTKWDAHATVPSKTEHELVNPAKVGKGLSATGEIIDKYIKRGREYVVVRSVMVDEDGVEIKRCVDHALLSLERTSEPDTVTTGAVDQSVADEVEDAVAAPERDPIIGTEIPSVVKTAYQRSLRERRFLSDSSHHDEYAKSKGYAGRLVSGYVLSAYMGEMLVDFFGPGWLKRGRFSVSFIGGGVQEEDIVTCRGIVTEAVKETAGIRAGLNIWMEKAQGLRVVVGTASGLLRGQGPVVNH